MVEEELRRLSDSINSLQAKVVDQNLGVLRLVELEEYQIPIGVKSISVTVTTDVMEIGLLLPWMSFTIVNDGAVTVYFAVNDRGRLQDQTGVDTMETNSVDMRYPVIEKIYLQAASATCAVRIYGLEGKRGFKDGH